MEWAAKYRVNGFIPAAHFACYILMDSTSRIIAIINSVILFINIVNSNRYHPLKKASLWHSNALCIAIQL